MEAVFVLILAIPATVGLFTMGHWLQKETGIAAFWPVIWVLCLELTIGVAAIWNRRTTAVAAAVIPPLQETVPVVATKQRRHSRRLSRK